MSANTSFSTHHLDQARAFLARVPLVDGHNDLPIVMREDSAARGDVAAYDLNRLHASGDTDIPRLKAGLLGAQFWAAFCPTHQPDPTRFTLELIQSIRDMHRLHAGVFRPALGADDVAIAKAEGRIASFIAVESGVGIGDRLEMLDIFHRLGARYMTLCHNETLEWIDSATDAPRHGGLTSFGERVVDRMNALGLMIDLSHATEQAQLQVIARSGAPVAITHANARTLCDHPRNATDAVLRALKSSGGVIMATFVPTFISQPLRDWVKPLQVHGKNPAGVDFATRAAERSRSSGPAPRATLAELCDHIDYMAQLIGVDHVGIGSDFYGGPTPIGLEDVSCFPALFAELMARGWGEDALEKLASGNILRVMRAVVDTARRA